MYNPMLHTNFSSPSIEADQSDPVGFQDISKFLRTSYLRILLFTVLAAFAGLAFCLLVTPNFTATAQVLIQSDNVQAMFQDAPRPESETETARIESQIEVIKSDQIAQSALRTLGLLDDPEFVGTDTGTPFYVPILDLIRSKQPSTPEDAAIARLNLALTAFSNRLTVRRITQSYVVEISFKSEDADKAAKIANALLAAYIAADVNAKAENARLGNQWLTQRLAELRKQASESRRAVEQFKTSGVVEVASERAVKLAELDSISQSQSRLYDVFLQRFMETAQKITYPVPDARVIASAAKPMLKSFPKTGLIIAFTALLGAAAGIGTEIIRRSSDDTVRTIRGVVSQTGCSVMGVVAEIPRPTRGQLGASGGTMIDSWKMEGKSRLALDVRSLKVSVNTALVGRSYTRIGITSVRSGEGKTTIAMNLAASFALSGTRTLLVDLCTDDPCTSRTLAPGVETGLVDFIRDPDVLGRVLVPVAGIGDLTVLPLGRTHWAASPAEQLAASVNREKAEILGHGYDLVLFDLPGVGQSPDIRAVAPLLNAVIVVVEFGATTQEDLKTAIATLRQSHTDILGIVINKSDPKQKLA